MERLKTSPVQAHSKVHNTDVLSITMPLINRMKLEGKSDKTITSYIRSVERLVRFHGMLHPRDMEIDEVLDFLVHYKEVRQINWRTNKMYVAGLRYYWTHMLEDEEFASKIPYPKEHPSLPKILSRQELSLLFNSCNNDKHQVMFTFHLRAWPILYHNL